MIRLSVNRFSKVFWDIIFESSDLLPESSVTAFKEQSIGLEALRDQAEYNTGSISISQAYLLFLTTLFFKPKRIFEVGTFIGRSTFAMAYAMDQYGSDGEVFTCDMSNEITLPWQGATQITQYQKQDSTTMLSSLEGSFDFIFLDGRVVDKDLELINSLITEKTIIALDDFEGMEKGVINLTYMKRLPKLNRHFLVYPPEQTKMQEYGLTGRSLLALMIPIELIMFTNQ